MNESAVDGKPRILVVDDEPAARRLLIRILERVGYRVEACPDIASAAGLLDRDAFDLVMTDLDMPEGSGFDLIDALGPRAPHVVTILVTGRGSTQIASHALMAGAYGYLKKPFLPDEVEVIVFNALRRRELELESRRTKEQLEATVRERTAALASSLAELRAAQNTLEEKAKELQELDTMKSQFIQVISHELRTPLTLITGGVQTVLRAGEAVGPELREQLLRSVESHAQDLGRMINKILTVATIRRSGIDSHHERFRLDEAALQAVEEATGATSGRVTVRAAEAWGFGHRELLKEALRDLIENALLHTEGTVVVSTWESDDEGVMSVSDQGPPPSDDLLQRLMDEPFVQGDSSTTRSAGGLGLSLYLANRIVDASAGTLKAETSETGSTFSITIPAQKPS